MITKERKTLTLDSDLIQAFDDENLSREINQILREELARRQSQTALAGYVAEFVAEFGEPDPDLVEEFRRALQ